jgi:hypothetical protein
MPKRIRDWFAGFWWRLTVMQKHTIPSTKETIRSGFLDPLD